MLSPVSIIERIYAAAYLVNNVLDLDCVVVGSETQITLELPANHLGNCFCQRIQAITEKSNDINHFFSRCEQISTSAEDASYAVYNCPHGLANIIVPAFDGGQFVAALQIGPIMTSTPDDLLLRHGALSRGADVGALEELRDYLGSLPKGNISYIMTIAKLVNALINDGNLAFKSFTMEEDMANSKFDSTVHDDIVCSVQEFVVDNFTNNEISLDMVAKHVYVHPSYVSRIFSKQFNSHFRSYINGLRINLAADMLANTDKSVGDICHEVGFSDHSYFNKVFKQLRGVTPSEYRNQIKADSVITD